MDVSTPLVVVFAVVVTTLTLLYKHFTKHFGYWESQGVPTEKPIPLFGTELSTFTTPVHETDFKRTKKFGKLFGAYFLTNRILNVADPEIIKLILVKDFHIFVNRQTSRSGIKAFDIGLIFALDDDWKRLRSIVSPTFSSGKLRKMTFLLKDIIKKTTENLMKLAEKEEPVNIKEGFTNYSVEVIGACVFGIRFDAFGNPNHPFIANSRKIFNGGLATALYLLTVSLLPQVFTILKIYLLKLSGISFFIDAAKEILQQRRTANMQKKVDFMQLLLDAKEEEPDISEGDGNKTESSTWSKTLNEDEIVAQCATFLLTGHDTIAAAVSFIAYNLALHPEVQDKLLQEIDDVWDKHGDIDYETINKLPYLHAVISETLRLHTIGIRTTRQAKEDYQIPNTNIIIPKDTIINILLYALHHNPEYFPDPEKFDPVRFLPENKDNIQPYTYMPFADGPRNCIATRFALINIKFCMAYFLRYIKFSATEETKKPLEFHLGGLSLQSKHGIIVRLQKRRNSVKS